MAILETKYSIGDVVFYAGTSITKKQHPCPDCLGSRKWTATSPAGREYEFSCPRCGGGYSARTEANLEYSEYAPSTRALTIGSVRFDTAGHSWNRGKNVPEYMCEETGVGSGNVYQEDLLFSTEQEALAHAEILASQQNSGTPWVVKKFESSLRVSDYQLSDAVMLAAQDERSRARSLIYNVDDLISKVLEANELADAIEAAENYRDFDAAYDKEKLTKEPAHV